MKTSNYIGLTYPTILGWKLIRYLWKRFMCPKHMHTLDECLSDEHYLVCDACDFIVYIDSERTNNASQTTNNRQG